MLKPSKANKVVIFDPNWSMFASRVSRHRTDLVCSADPAHDLQAMDRYVLLINALPEVSPRLTVLSEWVKNEMCTSNPDPFGTLFTPISFSAMFTD